MSTEAWKLEKDLCRCCHAEGSFHNLAEPRYKLGQQEIYIEMLRQCLDINLSPVSGLLCSMTFTICDSCVQRLRDASNFKKQVQLCEERFKDMYSNVMKALNPGLTTSYEVKLEEIPVTLDEGIKEEYLNMSDDDDGFDVVMDDDDDDDDKTVLQVKLDNAKKAKAKPKPAPKSKAKKLPQKKTVTPRKKAEKTETAAKSEDKPKKGFYRTSNTTEDQYCCNACGKGFSSQPLVAQHYRCVHLKKRPDESKCPLCDVRLPGYKKAYHMEEAHGIPPPTCGVCQKKYRYPYQVVQHQKRAHMGEKTVVCSVCDKGFFDSKRLKVHMATHSSEKQFTCQYCAKEFKWETNLQAHIKIHTGDRKYPCGLCGKAYIRKSNLLQHMASNHDDEDGSGCV